MYQIYYSKPENIKQETHISMINKFTSTTTKNMQRYFCIWQHPLLIRSAIKHERPFDTITISKINLNYFSIDCKQKCTQKWSEKVVILDFETASGLIYVKMAIIMILVRLRETVSWSFLRFQLTRSTGGRLRCIVVSYYIEKKFRELWIRRPNIETEPIRMWGSNTNITFNLYIYCQSY